MKYSPAQSHSFKFEQDGSFFSNAQISRKDYKAYKKGENMDQSKEKNKVPETSSKEM